jgi:hypothetical protein
VERLLRHLASLNRRTVASAGIFVVFAIGAAVAGAQGKTMQDDTLVLLLLPLVGAFVTLPRSTSLSPWPSALDDDEAERLEMMRDQLRVVERRATTMRFFYLGIAFLLLAILPRLGV